MPDWSTFRNSLLRKLAEMTALFRHRNSTDGDAPPKDRRYSPIPVRLRAGLFARYSLATGVSEFDSFQRDAKTWADFEHAALPEISRFTFFDAHRQQTITPAAALADAMYHVWTITELGLETGGRPTTIQVIKELANYLCSVYEVTSPDRRNDKRAFFGN